MVTDRRRWSLNDNGRWPGSPRKILGMSLFRRWGTAVQRALVGPPTPDTMTAEAYLKRYRSRECMRSSALTTKMSGSAFAWIETPASEQVMADMHVMLRRLEADPDLLRATAREDGITITTA